MRNAVASAAVLVAVAVGCAERPDAAEDPRAIGEAVERTLRSTGMSSAALGRAPAAPPEGYTPVPESAIPEFQELVRSLLPIDHSRTSLHRQMLAPTHLLMFQAGMDPSEIVVYCDGRRLAFQTIHRNERGPLFVSQADPTEFLGRFDRLDVAKGPAEP